MDKKKVRSKDDRKEIKEIKSKEEEYLNNWKRAQADYFNLKRRVEEDKEQIISLANKDLILQILPVLDNFRRAFRHVPDEYKDSEWIEGIKHLERQLEEILKNEGLERIPTLEHEFDPNLHEAVLSEKKKGIKKSVILEELESGYKFKNKVIKAAKVKVAK
jgi:molecular chaperone GrpE